MRDRESITGLISTLIFCISIFLVGAVAIVMLAGCQTPKPQEPVVSVPVIVPMPTVPETICTRPYLPISDTFDDADVVNAIKDLVISVTALSGELDVCIEALKPYRAQ